MDVYDSLLSGTHTPGNHEVAPAYVIKARKGSYCIQAILEVTVLVYLIAHRKCKIKFVYAQMAMIMGSTSVMLVVLFVPQLSYAIDNPGFYIVQLSRLLDLLVGWTYIYYILRVSLLVPTYLNFKRLRLYRHQRRIAILLYWTNGVALVFIFADIITTSLVSSYNTVWLSFLPFLIQGAVLILAMKYIRREILEIGL